MTRKHEINTYAVLDIETTGLPEYNYFKTSITEISIYAFSKREFENSKNCEIPRVNQKLTLLFNPMKQIAITSTALTGLDNYLLENESKFDEKSANILIAFFERLQQPVCLVAHNGNNFDFPIVKASLEKIQKELPSNVLCVDSLPAFRFMDANEELLETLQTDSLKVQKPLEEVTSECPSVEENLSVLQTVLSDENDVDWQKINENTPKRQKIYVDQVNLHKNNIKLNRLVVNSCRELFPSTSTSNKRYGYYKLATVYERIFKTKQKDAHRAEADVECLQKILLHYGNRFVEYSEENAISFSNIPLNKMQKYISN